MTFAELIEDVHENVSLAQGGAAVVRGEIKRLMNLKMREVSLEVGIPTLYVDVPSTGFVTGRFQMPVRFHPEGIKYAEVVEVSEGTTSATEQMKNQEIPLLTVQEANEFHPTWEDDEDVPYYGPPFLVWSPAAPDEGVRPVGIVSASYRFLVHAVPEPMTDDDHEPFSVLDYCDPDNPIRRPGAMPAYHRVLAHFVSHELLQRIGDERWQAYFARYRDMKMEMYSQVQPVNVYMPTWGPRNRSRHA